MEHICLLLANSVGTRSLGVAGIGLDALLVTTEELRGGGNSSLVVCAVEAAVLNDALNVGVLAGNNKSGNEILTVVNCEFVSWTARLATRVSNTQDQTSL